MYGVEGLEWQGWTEAICLIKDFLSISVHPMPVSFTAVV